MLSGSEHNQMLFDAISGLIRTWSTNLSPISKLDVADWVLVMGTSKRYSNQMLNDALEVMEEIAKTCIRSGRGRFWLDCLSDWFWYHLPFRVGFCPGRLTAWCGVEEGTRGILLYLRRWNTKLLHVQWAQLSHWPWQRASDDQLDVEEDSEGYQVSIVWDGRHDLQLISEQVRSSKRFRCLNLQPSYASCLKRTVWSKGCHASITMDKLLRRCTQVVFYITKASLAIWLGNRGYRLSRIFGVRTSISGTITTRIRFRIFGKWRTRVGESRRCGLGILLEIDLHTRSPRYSNHESLFD